MIDIQRYQKLKKQLGDLQREKDRAEGALAQLMKELHSEFDCNTLEKAEALLKETAVKVRKAEEAFEEAMEEFEEVGWTFKDGQPILNS